MSADETAGAAPSEPGNGFTPVGGPAPEDARPKSWASPAFDPAAAQPGGAVPPYSPQPGTGPAAPQYFGQYAGQNPGQTQVPGQFQAPGQIPGQAPGQYPGQPQFQGQYPGQQPGPYPGQVPGQYQNPPAWDPRFAPARPVVTPSQRRRRVISVVVPVVVVAIVGIGLIVKFSSSNNPSPAPLAAPTTSAITTDPATDSGNGQAPGASPSGTSEPVGYFANGTAARDVGIPTFDAAAAQKTYTITIQTNHGNIVFTAVGAKAPYTVYNFVYLIQKAYYSDTPCHRLTTSGLYVLQCGDPTGTGSGGPGYKFQDENLNAYGAPDSSGSVTYPAGAVAMANSGPDTNGSQFFLVYQDSPLPPNYTPFGTITQGLDILKAIAAQGSDNSNGSGDGKPNETVQIEKITAS